MRHGTGQTTEASIALPSPCTWLPHGMYRLSCLCFPAITAALHVLEIGVYWYRRTSQCYVYPYACACAYAYASAAAIW